MFLCSRVCLHPVSPECDFSVSRNVRLNVLVCVYVSGKEQRQAQIADMCSFYLLEEKGNAMRILADRVSGQTVSGTDRGGGGDCDHSYECWRDDWEANCKHTLTTQVKTHPNILLFVIMYVLKK